VTQSGDIIGLDFIHFKTKKDSINRSNTAIFVKSFKFICCIIADYVLQYIYMKLWYDKKSKNPLYLIQLDICNEKKVMIKNEIYHKIHKKGCYF